MTLSLAVLLRMAGAAVNALRSYQYGNSCTFLAKETADALEDAIVTVEYPELLTEVPDPKVTTGAAELCSWIASNVRGISIHTEIDGKTGDYMLSDMPADLAVQHALRMVRQRLMGIEVQDVEEG